MSQGVKKTSSNNKKALSASKCMLSECHAAHVTEILNGKLQSNTCL